MAVGRPRIIGLKLLTLRLRVQDIRAARREGRKRALPYQTVLREWIAEKAGQPPI